MGEDVLNAFRRLGKEDRRGSRRAWGKRWVLNAFRRLGKEDRLQSAPGSQPACVLNAFRRLGKEDRPDMDAEFYPYV